MMYTVQCFKLLTVKGKPVQERVESVVLDDPGCQTGSQAGQATCGGSLYTAWPG